MWTTAKPPWDVSGEIQWIWLIQQKNVSKVQAWKLYNFLIPFWKWQPLYSNVILHKFCTERWIFTIIPQGISHILQHKFFYKHNWQMKSLSWQNYSTIFDPLFCCFNIFFAQLQAEYCLFEWYRNAKLFNDFLFGGRNILSSIQHAYNIQLSQNCEQLKFYASSGEEVMLIMCLIINGSTGCKLHMWTIRSEHKQYTNFAHRVLKLVEFEGKQLQCTPLNPTLFIP